MSQARGRNRAEEAKGRGRARRRGGDGGPSREKEGRPAAPGEKTFSLLPAWFRHSPSLAVGCFCVLPLWAAYEWARSGEGLSLPPNGAEALILWIFGSMGEAGWLLLRGAAGLLVLGSGFLLLKRRVPWIRVGLLVVLEGLVWGSLIGPLGLLFSRKLMAGGGCSSWEEILFRSLGAGLYEELFFRLFLLSLLYFLFSRALAFHDAPRIAAMAASILLSGFLFALAHHLGPGGEPLVGRVLLFRTVMGVLLGILFVLRGFGVVVYAHAWYDILFYWFAC